MSSLLSAWPALQLGLFATPLGKLFILIVVIGLIILVGRFALSIAWRLVTIAAVIVGALLLLSMFGVF